MDTHSVFSRKFLKFELWFQGIFLFIWSICLIGFIFETVVLIVLALLIAIILGAWQLFSGLVGTIKGSRWRSIYMIGVVLYFVFFFTMLDELNQAFDDVLNTIPFILPPVIFGYSYWYYTYKELETLPQLEKMKNEKELDDILDAEF